MWPIDLIESLGDRIYMIAWGELCTYADFSTRIERAGARLFDAGVASGDVVLLEGLYGVDMTAYLFALAANGNMVIPCLETRDDVRKTRIQEGRAEWAVKPGEPGEETKNARVARLPEAGKATRGGGSKHPLVAKLIECGHPGLILFSSGTTGKPKAMLHDFRRLLESYSSENKRRDSRVFAFMGIDHIGGLDILFRAMASGSTLVVPADRSPEKVAALIQRHRVDVLPATPTFLNLLLLSGVTDRYDLSSLRIIGYGAEPMPEVVLGRLKEAFPWVKLQQKFGTSETNAIRISGRSEESLEMRIEDPRVEWKVVDGELWLKSPARIVGYLNSDGAALTEDGWYRTGDLVRETGDGFFRIAGRRTDLINTGGEKVFPAEVENCILEMPGIEDCRVFGESNALMGKVVAVEVVSTEALKPAELKKRLRKFCQGRLDAYKIPVKVYLRDGIDTAKAAMKKRREAAIDE